MLNQIFNLGRVIDEDSSNPYLHLAYINKLNNYRVVTDGELLINGRGLDIPEYVINFIHEYKEALMIANFIDGIVVNIVFRTLGDTKRFIKLGPTKLYFYGIGELDKDFKYGDPILIVEGHLDRDVMKELFNNTIALTTNRISKIQAKFLINLTNNYIIMPDNDNAGLEGLKQMKYQLRDCNVKVMNVVNDIKDAGDLVKLELKDINKYNIILNMYKTQLKLFTI